MPALIYKTIAEMLQCLRYQIKRQTSHACHVGEGTEPFARIQEHKTPHKLTSLKLHPRQKKKKKKRQCILFRGIMCCEIYKDLPHCSSFTPVTCGANGHYCRDRPHSPRCSPHSKSNMLNGALGSTAAHARPSVGY